jgi:hypothetical protein
LPALLAAIQTKPEPRRTIRYIVDLNKQIWFAEEGEPSKTTPPHGRMTGQSKQEARCIAAGNIDFSDDYERIVMVNHKSGDFRADFDSVKWPLAILAANQDLLTTISIQFDKQVTIEQLTSSGGPQDLHINSEAELTAWVAEYFNPEERKILTNQPSEVRTFSYPKPVAENGDLFFKKRPSSMRGAGQAEPESATKRLSFD